MALVRLRPLTGSDAKEFKQAFKRSKVNKELFKKINSTIEEIEKKHKEFKLWLK